jgi:RHH-type transcriptional regulator, rel operon repressor / antitoxin RelB
MREAVLFDGAIATWGSGALIVKRGVVRDEAAVSRPSDGTPCGTLPRVRTTHTPLPPNVCCAVVAQRGWTSATAMRDQETGTAVLECVHHITAGQPMSTTMTVRLEDDVKDRLDVLAQATQRSKSFLAAEAIRAYVENNEWQIGEIQAALKEADAGDFADDKEVAALARKWKVNAA